MDGSIDSSTAGEGDIGGIDDGVHRLLGDVPACRFNLHNFRL